MLAPPAEAAPTSEIHSAADELFCTRNPFAGTTPPNSAWALPPAAIVPLPSLATAPVVLITGRGFCGPTTLDTPCALVAAGACTGTRLPLPSTSVRQRLHRGVGVFDEERHGASFSFGEAASCR